MNTIKITLLNDGTTARIDKDFAVYKNSYRNVLIDIYVPTSILNLNLGYTHSVKIGAERTAANGAETTTNSYYVDYKTTETIANVEYYVFERLLPREFVEIAGNETIVTNVVLFNNSSLTEIITSENVVLQIQDSNYILDDEIEDDDTVAEIEADITDLQERVGESETDITELQGQVSTNTENIATHTSQIANIIADLNIQETYIGKIESTTAPENVSASTLNQYVIDNTTPSREPRNGDVIIYVYQNPGTDKNYKFIYSVSTGWNYYELPPMEEAGNNTFGLVKGSYNQTRDVKVSINAGEFTEIYVKNLTTGNYYPLANFLKSLYDEQQAIINGSQAVGLANRAVNDGNGNNIANTYLTQNAGATKEFVKDYSLPKEFYQTYFIEADGYTDRPPTEPVSGVQFTKQTSAVGEFEIFNIYRTNNSKMRLTAKNSSSTTIYISANQNTTIQLKLLNYIKKPNENAQTLSVELSNELELTSGSIYKVDFQSNFNDLNNVFDADENDIVGQVLSVITQDIATTTFSVYSNEVYPSSQTMNVQSLVIVTQQGELGEIPVYDLNGTITGTQIDFDFGENQVYANTLARFVLRVSEQTQLPTTDTLNLIYGGQNVRIATPYNFLSGNATIKNLEQTNITFDAVNGTVIDFVGFIDIDSGDNITVIVNEDNLSNFNSASWGNITGTLSNQTDLQNALNNKLDKVTSTSTLSKAYIKYADGTQGMLNVNPNYTDQSGDIVSRNTGGQIKVPLNPSLGNDATSKNYVDTGLATKQGTLSQTQLDAVNSGIDSTKVTQISTNTNNITTINLKIPSGASSSNKMTTRDEVVGGIDLSINSSTYVITLQCKDVDGNNLGNAKTIDLPLESVVVSGSYDNVNKKVILTLQDGSTIEFSVADLVSGLQTEITSSNKLDSDLVDDTNQTNKFVTSSQVSKIDNAVQKTGDENIYGLKTFNQRPKVGINPDLPQAYQLLDYIEGTGSQYIKTGTHSDGSRTVTAEIAFTDVTSGATQILVGGRPLNSGVGMGYIALRNNHLAYLTGGTWKESSFTPVLNQKYTVSCYQGDGGPQSMSVNGTTILSSSEHAYGNTKTNYLFAFNNQDSAQNYMKAKLYSCKIYEGSSLVRNFVPCLRLSDNKTGMFDRVSNTFYANQTVTEFTTGAIDTDASLVALKSDIEANPTLIGTESNLTAIKIKGNNYKIDAGVVTVNGQSGSVTLDADDISDSSTTNKFVTASEKTQIGTNATDISNLQTSKQDTLISGTTLKTINNQSLLGSGNIDISGGGGGTGITNYEVIDRISSIPTATATSPDFVQINGKLYQKKITNEVPSTVTDLSGTTWVFDDNISSSNFDDMNKSINFTSNSNNYTALKTFAYPLEGEPDWVYMEYDNTNIYASNNYDLPTWANSAFKTIEIVDGTDVEDTTLINFLQENATLQTTVIVYSYEEAGVQSIGGSVGTITLGNGLKMTNNVLDTPSPDLLWENSSPTSSFAAQTITVNFTGYKFFYILCKLQNTDADTDLRLYSPLIPITGFQIRSQIERTNAPWNYGQRVFVFDGVSNIPFESAYNGTSQSAANNLFIPVKIYGIK